MSKKLIPLRVNITHSRRINTEMSYMNRKFRKEELKKKVEKKIKRQKNMKNEASV